MVTEEFEKIHGHDFFILFYFEWKLCWPILLLFGMNMIVVEHHVSKFPSKSNCTW